MKARKRNWILAAMVLLILALLCSCGASREAKEIDAGLQEQQAGLAQAEAAYLKEDGTVAPEDASKAVQAVAEYAAGALERGEIAAYTQEENGVLLQLESGVNLVYLPKVQGMLAGGGKMELLTLEPYDSDPSFAVTEWFGSALSLESCAKNMLLQPQLSLGETEYTYRKALQDGEVSIAALKKLPDHACIFLLGHGGYLRATGPLISSGEAYSLDTLSRYLDDFMGARLYVGSDGSLMVGAAFFETYYEDGDLQDDLIYLACCSGLEGEELAETLLKKGADTVVGATASIPIWYEKMMVANVMQALGQGMDISQAIAYGEGDSANLLKHGVLFNQQLSDLLSGARMVVRGNTAYSLAQPDFAYDALAARSEPYSHGSILDTTLQAEAKSGDFSYCLAGDQAILLEYTGKAEELEVPAEIDGYEVLAVGQKCFAGNTHLKKVVIPNTIRALHPYAFYECSSLTQLTIGYGVQSIGFYALEGTSVMEISVYEGSNAAAWCEAQGWPNVYKSLVYLPMPQFSGHVVAYEDALYYWKYQTDSFAATGVFSNYYALPGARNQLIRRTADGQEQVLLTSDGTGRLAISDGRIYYQVPTDDYGDTAICSVALDGSDQWTHGEGRILATTTDGGSVVCSARFQKDLSLIEGGSGVRTVFAGDGEFLLVQGGRIYYQVVPDADQVLLYSAAEDGSDARLLFTGQADFWYGTHIEQLIVQGEYAYFSYGAKMGTGIVYQGGKIARARLDGSGGEVLAGWGNTAAAEFVVNSEGEVTSYAHDDSSLNCIPMNTYYNREGSIYIWEQGEEAPRQVIAPADYAQIGPGNCNEHTYEGSLYIDCIEEIDGHVYFRAQYGTAQFEGSLGWRTNYARQNGALLDKDMQTGEVRELFRY